MLTPLQLQDRYRKLDVTLDDNSTVRVDVHVYQLNGNNNAKALVAKDALIGKLDAEKHKAKADVVVGGVNASQSRAKIALCFMGKGSPADIALALRLVSRYGLAPQPGGLQAYCDANIGLDCNGFVGNYTRERGLTLGPSTDIDAFRQKGTLRTAVGDVRDRDVMVWKDKHGKYGHITIIEALCLGPWWVEKKIYPRCVVVESSGGVGLHDSEYQLVGAAEDKATKRTVFTVKRPNGTSHQVYIVSLAL